MGGFTAYESTPELLTLHAVRLLGFADTARVAYRFRQNVDEARERLLDFEAVGWVSHSEFGGAAGWSMTPMGRAEGQRRLVEELDRRVDALGAPPAGALVFTCNGRGQAMFGVPDHDAGAVTEALGGAPTGGFFCAGEIGPVGKGSYVHGFTATLAVFPA